MHTAALRPIRFRPWARPTVVVDFPSPSGVGVIAVTTTYLPRGFAVSRRSIPASVIFALVWPYGSISSSCNPRSRATSMIGRGVTDRAISRSDGKVIELLGWCLRHDAIPRWQRHGLALRRGRQTRGPVAVHERSPSPGGVPRARDERAAAHS